MVSYAGLRFQGVTTPQRSKIMSAVRSKRNRSTELRLARILRKHGLSGWRRHLPIFGCPDFTFRAHRTVVFVDGCFWHGCPKCYKCPRTNSDFWTRKVAVNRSRDRLVSRYLRQEGWKVVRIWEHCLRDEEKLVARLRRALCSS
ncbi:very short patch repair endonuclease [Paraburkholderia terrae]|uniref:Very short patch repair endonuclease n=2 Tax=Paraburkholderia terrae TaxID=311230 RepID=A0A2I8EHE3_9BURK|nr:very short patch repair endonuclease [Paraburkholderia terrae]